MESRAHRYLTWRRTWIIVGVLLAAGVAYLLRGVIVPLFLAFLLAYALDPFVDRLEALKVPRTLGAMLVMIGIFALIITILVYAIPLFLDELRAAARDLPSQVENLEDRLEPWLWNTFKLKVPHSLGELGHSLGERLEKQGPGLLSALALALFGTLSYVAVVLSALIVPVFALYLLIDFDRIVAHTGQLVPRRWIAPVTDVANQIHRTLGGYVRGQLTANFVLAALYATGLRIVDIRLAVAIGVATGMMAFVPYIGFFTGLFIALAMATLDWHGPGRLLGVLAVMGGVQLLDGLLITPRIVGRSVGLAPIEVLITMMAAASLFGFLGVLLAVPLGAVVKILIQRVVRVYLTSDFYSQA
ncbi:AI-2E family transporter [Pendulispora rubella]|uniref:AI-2E family transporter n=1 Tax=Pendulispora rubella TaxID=2741070 RepID=A0ABZ2LI00_9BACT